jgi:hypothetical protein
MIGLLGVIGWTELVLISVLVISAATIVLGITLRSGQRRAVGSGETPSLPRPKQSAAPAGHLIVHARGGTSLAAQLREHANLAEVAKLRPFLEFGAVWCPPSRIFGNALEDPRMKAALAGVYLIRAELDDFANDPYTRELRASVVPAFYELDAEGRWTGRQINGGAWGVDTLENISRTMAGFFAG